MNLKLSFVCRLWVINIYTRLRNANVLFIRVYRYKQNVQNIQSWNESSYRPKSHGWLTGAAFDLESVQGRTVKCARGGGAGCYFSAKFLLRRGGIGAEELGVTKCTENGNYLLLPHIYPPREVEKAVFGPFLPLICCISSTKKNFYPRGGMRSLPRPPLLGYGPESVNSISW